MITSGAFNTTQTTVSSSIGSPALLAIVFTAAMIIAVLLAFYSVDYLTRVITALSKIFASVKYVVYGLLVTGGLYVIYELTKVVMSTAAPAMNPIYFGYGIGGYIVFYVIGRVSEYAARRMLRTVDEYKERRTVMSQVAMTAVVDNLERRG